MIRLITAFTLIFLVFSGLYVLAGEQNVLMEIDGMTCKLCSVAVKKSLSEVDGVDRVNVSLKEQNVRLKVDESISDEALVQAVERAGEYTVISILILPVFGSSFVNKLISSPMSLFNIRSE